MTVGKVNNRHAHSFIVGNSNKSKSYDGDEHYMLTVTVDATIVVEHYNEAES